jgi:AGCS family alanine or glycine:cation symporter
MKFKKNTLLALILPLFSFAQNKGIDQKIDEAFQPIADAFF